MLKHAVSIKWSDEDDGYIASIPGIAGLSAFGKTREEALSELDVAAEAFFESLKEAGRPLPAEEKAGTFSGQTRLRMPRSLHAELSAAAEREGVSLNTYIVSLLSRRDAEHDAAHWFSKLSNMICRGDISPTSGAKNTDFGRHIESPVSSTVIKYPTVKEH